MLDINQVLKPDHIVTELFQQIRHRHGIPIFPGKGMIKYHGKVLNWYHTQKLYKGKRPIKKHKTLT